MTAELRVLTVDDTPALTAAMARAVEAGDMQASSDPAGAFVMKSFAVDPGLFGGAFEDGALVGFVSIDFKIVVVAPGRRRRGMGRALVDIAGDVARDRGRPELIMGVVPGDPVGLAFLRATAFAYHSSVWDLELPAGRAVDAPRWPEGLAARPFAGRADVDEWIRVFNLAFADHATPMQLERPMVIASLEDPDNEDDDVILAEDAATRELVGFCATDPGRREGRVGEHGEIWSVGVRPDRQGRGLGRQLVRAGVERLRSIGVPLVDLTVNGRNEGALHLYESEGFVRTRTRERWSRPTAVTG